MQEMLPSPQRQQYRKVYEVQSDNALMLTMMTDGPWFSLREVWGHCWCTCKVPRVHVVPRVAMS